MRTRATRLCLLGARGALALKLSLSRLAREQPRQNRSLRSDERGLATVLFAVALMPFILASLAIVVETGFVLATRADLQRTADAAALAGAFHALESPAQAEAHAEVIAEVNYPELVTNEATATANYVTASVEANADSLFTSDSWLSFGEPLVRADAVARAAAPRLPGPGVFCLAVALTTQQAAEATQGVLGSPLTHSWAELLPYLTILRTGSGAGSNAGFIDIEGPVSQNTRDCLTNGSANPVEPVEETETGLSTGQARQGLQDRLEVARDRACFTWDDIVASIAEADGDGDGVADAGAWRCDPLANQGTAVVLIPVVAEDFQLLQGNSPITVHDLGSGSTYQFALFWIDALRTFEDVNASQWKFVTSGGQGQAEILGLFLLDRPTVITQPPSGVTGGVVDCQPASVAHCFVQLLD